MKRIRVHISKIMFRINQGPLLKVRLYLGLEKQAVIILSNTFFTAGSNLKEIQNQLTYFNNYNKIYIIIPEITMTNLETGAKRGGFPTSRISKKALKEIYALEENSEFTYSLMGNNLEVTKDNVTYLFPNESNDYHLAAKYGIRIENHLHKAMIKLLVLAQKYSSMYYDSFVSSTDGILCRYALRRNIGHLDPKLKPKRMSYEIT